MSRTRLRRRVGPSSLFLHDARRKQLVDRTKVASLRERTAQLRPETPSRTRARAARSLRVAHARVAKSDLFHCTEIPGTDAARSDLEKIPKRGSALSPSRTGIIRST